MTHGIKKVGVCAVLLGLQCGLGLAAVSAAPVYEDRTPTTQQAWNAQEQEALTLKQQEIRRHEQAMLQRENESVADWEWRQWQEREQHILNMQRLQDDGLKFIGTPVNW